MSHLELAQLLSLRYVLYTVKGRQFMNPTTSCLYYNIKRLYWLKIIIIAYSEVVYLGIGPVMAGYIGWCWNALLDHKQQKLSQ